MQENLKPEDLPRITIPHVDQQIRNAILMCWMVLPESRRNADEVEKQVRRIVDRAIRDFRDDMSSFSF